MSPRVLALTLGLVAAGLAAAAWSVWPSGPATVTLDPGTVLQELTGWEATTDVADVPSAPPWEPYEAELHDRVVDEIGINRVRIGIRSGTETPSRAPSRFIAGEIDYATFKAVSYDIENDNDDPQVIDPDGFDFAFLDWQVEHVALPLRERLEARGERLVVNVNYVAFSTGPTLHDDPDEYAEFVLASYQHMEERFGFVPDLWEVMLEPDLLENEWDGAAIGAAMVAAGARLQEAGYEPAFVAPSVTDMSNALPYAEGIASVPGAADHWAELSYHRYRGNSPRTLRALAAFADEQGLRTSMLEWWFGKGTRQVLLEDLAIGNVSAWQGRVVSGFHTVEQTADGYRLTPREDARTNALYYRAGRLGWHRIGATSDAPRSVAPVAFSGPDGAMAVVVAADRARTVIVAGLPPGDYELSFALDESDGPEPQPLAVGAGPVEVEMPAPGLLSVAPPWRN